jgi:hypothetical protein
MHLGVVFVPDHSCRPLPEPSTNQRQSEQLQKQPTDAERRQPRGAAPEPVTNDPQRAA